MRIGQALANVATVGLLQERNRRRSETVAERLQAALSVTTPATATSASPMWAQDFVASPSPPYGIEP